MALRIEDSVVRGVLDNRTPGKVTGTIWLAGRGAPVKLRLRGNALRDVAGCRLIFEHRHPEQLQPGILAVIQEGVVGTMTGSHRARVPTISTEDLRTYFEQRLPIPTVWANLLYMEWFSERNGRVVLESPDFDLHISQYYWCMTREQEERQCKANAAALHDFMRRLTRGK